MNNSNLSLTDLLSGKTVICDSCHKGKMVPINKTVPIKQNHGFVCDNCGEVLNITSAVTVE